MSPPAAWLAAARLLLVLDAAALRRLDLDAVAVASEVLDACPPGAVALLDRDTTATSDRLRLRRVRELASLADRHRAGLVVSGRPDLAALAASAAGGAVQLPERGLPAVAVAAAFPGLAIGRSCHDRPGLHSAARSGAAWATLAPVFQPLTPKTRLSRPPHGLLGLADVLHDAPLPVFALGGVAPENVAAVAAAGASRIACIGAVLAAPSPGVAAAALIDGLRS